MDTATRLTGWAVTQEGPAATSTHHSPVRPSGRRTSTRGGHPVTNHRTIQPDAWKVIVGVDTHKARPRGRGDRHVGDPPRRSIVCRRLRRLPTADHLGRASRTRRRVRHRGHRQLRGGTRARGPASRAPGARSEPGRPAHPSNRREVRHRGCRGPPRGRSWLANRPPSRRPRTGRSR